MNESVHVSLNAKDLARILRAENCRLPFPDAPIQGILFDTREPGFAGHFVFFAIQGLNHDGHTYIDAAIEKGCSTIVVEKPGLELPDVNIIEVTSSQFALQELGWYCRRNFSGLLAALAGSNGKTTIKDWAWELLISTVPTYKSPGSYNSQIGVPLSLWFLNNRYKVALIETGASLPGEIERLEGVVLPDLVLYTHIGDAHDSNYTSHSSKVEELGRLASRAKVLILNAGQPYTHEILLSRASHSARVVLYGFNNEGSESSDYSVFTAANGELQWRCKGHFYPITFFSRESEDIENLSAALALAIECGGEPEFVVKAISGLRPVEMRMEIREGAYQRTLINDVWCNDITSLKRALQQLWQFRERGPLYLIYTPFAFPDSEGRWLPETLLEEVLKDWLTGLWGIGNLFAPLKARFPDKVSCFDTVEDLIPSARSLPAGSVVLIKGARVYRMERILRILEGSTHTAQLQINLHAAVQNLRYYRSRYPSDLRWMVLLKAAGYGAGEVELAQAMQTAGVDYLAVAAADEGVRLRRAGIQLPILVLNPALGQFSELIRYNLEPGLYSINLVKSWLADKEASAFPFHVKLNTGMNRLGVDSADGEELLLSLKEAGNALLVSVYSHLAASDDPEADDFTRQQLDRLNEFAKNYASVTRKSVLTHISNSGAIQRGWVGDCSMVRLGIGLYGISVRPEDKPFLKEVLNLTTSILQIRELKKGEQIGYGLSTKLERDSRVAVLALGYADGYRRSLGFGKGKILVHGKLCPTLGAVSMDLLSIDITNVPEAREGDIVLVFGADYSIVNMAMQAETIPYEIMTGLGRRLPRIFIRE
jgi:Alr-MurF fusion protein